MCKKPKCPNQARNGWRLCEQHIKEAKEKTKKFIKKSIVIDSQTDCWKWTAGLQQGGYGYMTSYGLSDNSKPAHWMSLFANGSDEFNILSHGQVHHTCGNEACVNPNHLIHVKAEFHELLHQLSNQEVARVVLDHLLEAYPHASAEINALRSAICIV